MLVGVVLYMLSNTSFLSNTLFFFNSHRFQTHYIFISDGWGVLKLNSNKGGVCDKYILIFVIKKL